MPFTCIFFKQGGHICETYVPKLDYNILSNALQHPVLTFFLFFFPRFSTFYDVQMAPNTRNDQKNMEYIKMPLINGMFFNQMYLYGAFKEEDHEKSPVSNLI